MADEVRSDVKDLSKEIYSTIGKTSGDVKVENSRKLKEECDIDASPMSLILESAW